MISTKTQRIIQNTHRREGDFNALLDAKKQLNDLFIEGADASA